MVPRANGIVGVEPFREAGRAVVGAQERTTAKFIQICASQNDLFALDENGNIWRYNFCTKAWATLGADVDGATPTRRMAVVGQS